MKYLVLAHVQPILFAISTWIFLLLFMSHICVSGKIDLKRNIAWLTSWFNGLEKPIEKLTKRSWTERICSIMLMIQMSKQENVEAY